MPAEEAAMILLRSIIKAHVRDYDRVTKTGAIEHIRAHEDSRVRSYARKILGSKDSYDLHTIRRDRFGHLPHWNKLDEHTRQAVLDAEEEKAKSHKSFEEWKEKAHGKKKESEKVDRSGWEQQLMFKGKPNALWLLRKSKQTHHRNSSIHEIKKTGTIYQAKATMATVNVSDKQKYHAGAVTDLVAMYRHVATTDRSQRKWRGVIFASVSKNAAKKIKDATGLNVRTYRHAADTSSFVHVFNRHGEGKTTDIADAITEQDIARIPDIIEHFDKVERGNSESGYPTILYTKKCEGVVYYVEEMKPVDGTNLLVTKTMFKHAARG